MTGMTEMPGFQDLIQKQVQAYNDAVEHACEAALQGGTCGVRVVSLPGQLEKGSGGDQYSLRIVDTYQIEVHPSVPYGTIHYYPQGLPDD